jgi:hypothetical protein
MSTNAVRTAAALPERYEFFMCSTFLEGIVGRR